MSRDIEIERFLALGDDGNEYTVVIKQTERDVPILEDRNATVRGMKTVLTITGIPLVDLGDGRFQVSGGGVTMKRL